MKRAVKILLRLLLVALITGVSGILLTLIFVLISLRGNAALPADCGVVFGAAVLPQRNGSGRVITSQAGPAILRRVQTAADLYKRGMLKKIFLTGGRGEGMRLSEAEVMRKVAIQDGVKPESLRLESQSRSTEENIAFTKPLTGSCSSIVAISDNYHLARISLLSWQSHWKVGTYPAASSAPFSFEWRSIVREVVAILYEAFFRFLGPLHASATEFNRY